MKHASFVVSIASVLAVAACTGQTGLPPSEVLSKAANASRNLQSVNFTGDGTVEMGEADARNTVQISAKGSLQDGGKQTQVRLTLDGSLRDKTESYELQGDAEIIAAAPGEVYLNLHSLATEPAHPLLSGDALKNLVAQWWKLPADGEGKASVSPDPSLLRAQSEVIKVTKDHGIETINGASAYHYDVEIDQEKLMAFMQKAAQEKGETFDAVKTAEFLQQFSAQGSVWIDSTNFYLHKLEWDILPVADAKTPYALTLSLTFTNHNAGDAIAPPATFNMMSPALLPMGDTAASLQSSSR